MKLSGCAVSQTGAATSAEAAVTLPPDASPPVEFQLPSSLADVKHSINYGLGIAESESVFNTFGSYCINL